MTAATLTLTADFLLARIAEDEAAARAVLDNKAYFRTVVWAYHDADYGDLLLSTYNDSGLGQPARVLAECEAKRRIVELHTLLVSERDWSPHRETHHCRACSSCCETDWDVDAWPCATLAALLTVYADHPDYREEWRP